MASPGDLSCPAYMARGCLQSPAPQTAEQPGPLGELSSWKVLKFLFWKTRYAWARMEEASQASVTYVGVLDFSFET